MEKTIILTGKQGSGKTFLSELISHFYSGKKIIKTDFHELGYITNVGILRKDLVIIEEVLSCELPDLLDRIEQMVPYLKRTQIIITCYSIPILKKSYKYTEIGCTYSQKIHLVLDTKFILILCSALFSEDLKAFIEKEFNELEDKFSNKRGKHKIVLSIVRAYWVYIDLINNICLSKIESSRLDDFMQIIKSYYLQSKGIDYQTNALFYLCKKQSLEYQL
jgi:hypothetical protein